MARIFSLFLLSLLSALTACAPASTGAPAGVTEPAPAITAQAATPAAATPTTADAAAAGKEYSNSAFGLSFRLPAGWFGPEEYISEPTLRVEIGSDQVYPYGQAPEQSSGVVNSYRIILQYTKHNQNTYWKETYDQVVKLKDGESVSGARSMLIRVRQLEIGRLHGVEFISTLSETAQTDPVYSREVILVDDQANLLTISGSPVNVDLSNGRPWRDAYRAIDDQNVEILHKVLESLTIQ
jgi:hypothetical protein